MKKIFFCFVALLLSAIMSFAENKFDLPAAQFVSLANQQEVVSRSGGQYVSVMGENCDMPITVIITFTSVEEALAYAENAAGDVLDVAGDMVMANLTASEMQILAENSSVKSISRGYDSKPLLNVARVTTGVNTIHEGIGLDQAYTGKGVITGLMDVGLDPNHENFKKDGVTRLGRLWVITGNNATPREYAGPNTIAAYTTDDENETHGTHVLGIMAGSFNGRASQVALINDRTGLWQLSKTRPIPYYGVATESEIAACAGSLQGNNVLLAARCVRNYAQEVGKPAVMNLSLGHNYGPHDGTSASNRYLEQFGQDMIICISAGNEGADKVSYHKDFTATETHIKTFVANNATASGIFDVWSADSSKPTVTFAIIDKTDGSIKYSYKVDPNSEETVYITGDYYTAPGYIHDAVFNDTFGRQSALIITGNVNPDNKRYNVLANLQLNTGSNAANLAPAFIIEGQPEKSVDIYCSTSAGMISNGLADFIEGNPDQSINDMACGKNVIVVGAYVNAEQFPALDGMRYYQGAVKNSIANFSSYGATFQGKKLPDITAPGMGIISSFSNYYVKNNSKAILSGIVGDSEKDKRVSYWAEMSGTSMSSPFVAGVCALWLQADPTLTVDDIKNVMKETADNDEFTAVHPERWGYGKINALAGIKKILGSSGIAGVVTDGSDMIVTPGVGAVEVFAAGAAKVRVELYTVGGALAAQTVGSGDTANISTEGLAKGVYVLRAVADGTRTATRKIAL